MGREILRSAAFAVLVSGLMGCFSDRQASSEPEIPDPYAGLDCAAKIDAIARDVQAYSNAQTPVPKRAADSAQAGLPGSGAVPAESSQGADSAAKRPVMTDLKGYPPVAGLDPATPTGSISVGDTRPPKSEPGSGSGADVQWIPPVGFISANGSPSVPAQAPEPMPTSISAALVVVNAAYRAEIGIYDYRNRLIRTMTQDFGYQGELDNPNRALPGGGYASYLVWDTRDAAGGLATTGAYLWRVRLRFESGQVEDRTLKIGLVGPECLQR